MKRSIKSLSRAYQDQTLGDDEIKDLDQILATDSEAREVFMRETNLIAALEDVAVDESAKEIGFLIGQQTLTKSNDYRNRFGRKWPLEQ